MNGNLGFKMLMSLLMVLLLSTVHLSAQSSATVSGKVTEANGSPLAGVSIVVRGTTINTVSDGNGAYSLRIPSGAQTLVFSFLGMETQEIAVESRAIIDVVMIESALGLEETVVIGYGTIIKRELSSAIASVDNEALTERATSFNVMQSLAGKVAGVRNVSMSGRPGGTSSLRIRGMGSINAGSNPIYVLDGVVDVDPSLINSADIESIDVLKDAAATAVYGAKGANGVVMITTKTGKQGKGSVTYDGRVGVSMLSRKLDLLNAEEYMEVQRRAYAYSGNVMPHLISPMENLFYYAKDASGNYQYDANGLLVASPRYDTDWQDAVTQNGIVNDHTLSFSAGKESTSVYASLGYQNVEGLVKTTALTRYSGTVNVKSKINDWLDLQAMAQGGSYESVNSDSENGFGQGALRNMMEMPPIVPIQYEDGTYGRKSDYPLGEVAENPLLLLEKMKIRTKTDYFVVDFSSDVHFTKDLTLTVRADYQTNNSKNLSYAKQGLLGYTENNGGYADISNSDLRRFSNEDYLTYKKSFFNDQLKSSFVLGASWYYYHTENSSSGSEQYFDDSFDYYNLGAGSVFHNPASGMNENTMNSYYFRMNHNFKDRYMLGFTFRADGASNFGANNKYGYFPSVSAAWVVSEEPFFESLKSTLNSLKIRASYGSVGNASIPSYRTISQYSNGNTIFNGALNSYVVLSNLGNADLKWETSNQLNIGLDMSIFGDRLEVVMDYYNKATTDLLFQKQVPYTTGYATSWTNLGKIRNTGFELTLNAHLIEHKNFQWDADFIFATNKVIVEDINHEIIELGNNARAVEGLPWGSFFVLNRVGTWGLNEVEEASKYGKKPGDLKFEDKNHDYVINDEDREYMGSGTPKGEITLVNTFRIKNFSLMIDLNAMYGFKVMNITGTMMENRQLYSNSVRTVLDAWSPEHQNSLIAAIRRPSDIYFGENEKDSRMLYKGDFLRIRNVMLSYDFKDSLFKNTNFVKALSLGVNAENLYVFTSYPGYDPEVGAFGNANTGQGIDFYSYPHPLTISANIRVSF